MAWLHRSPIPVGRRGVISSFKWFLPPVASRWWRWWRGGGGRHPVPLTHPQLRTAKKIRIMCSQKSKCKALFPISIFIHLWAIYLFPGSVHLFCWSRLGRPIVGIHKSLADIWMQNCDSGRTVSFLGIFFQIFGTVSLRCVSIIFCYILWHF